MKSFCKISCIALLALFCFSDNSRAQVTQVSPLESFMQNAGVKDLANLAHALNTFTDGTYSFAGNNITVQVNYRNGNYEVIKLHYEPDGDYFENVRSTDGQESAYSFFAAGTLVNLIAGNTKTCIERFFHSNFSSMSGQQIAAAMMTAFWWKWEGKSCN